jgi:hypothetical protein
MLVHRSVPVPNAFAGANPKSAIRGPRQGVNGLVGRRLASKGFRQRKLYSIKAKESKLGPTHNHPSRVWVSEHTMPGKPPFWLVHALWPYWAML